MQEHGALAVGSAREAAAPLPGDKPPRGLRRFKGQQVRPGLSATWAPGCWRLPSTHQKGVWRTPPRQQTPVLAGASQDAPVLRGLVPGSQGPRQLSRTGGWPRAPQGGKALGQRGLDCACTGCKPAAVQEAEAQEGLMLVCGGPARSTRNGRSSALSRGRCSSAAAGSFVPGPRTPGRLFLEPVSGRAAGRCSGLCTGLSSERSPF